MTREYVAQEMTRLDESELERLAVFISGLKIRARVARQALTMTPEIAARYAQFAQDDVALAEAGMEDFADTLGRDDR